MAKTHDCILVDKDGCVICRLEGEVQRLSRREDSYAILAYSLHYSQDRRQFEVDVDYLLQQMSHKDHHWLRLELGAKISRGATHGA